MVAHQFLALLVRVRVLAGQLKKDAWKSVFLFLNNHTIHFIEGTHDKTTIIIHIVNSSPYGNIIRHIDHIHNETAQGLRPGLCYVAPSVLLVNPRHIVRRIVRHSFHIFAGTRPDTWS